MLASHDLPQIRAATVKVLSKFLSPLSPEGRGVGGEGFGACLDPKLSGLGRGLSPSPLTPLPQGRGEKYQTLKVLARKRCLTIPTYSGNNSKNTSPRSRLLGFALTHIDARAIPSSITGNVWGWGMARTLVAIGLCSMVANIVGCASVWETAGSKRFRNDPFKTMFSPPDPMTVLQSPTSSSDDRARAFQRLEPQDSPSQQAAALKILSESATSDASPWVRICAIDALGRFDEPQTANILIAAYHQAEGHDGPPQANVNPATLELVSAGRSPTAPLGEDGVVNLSGPEGFSADQVRTIRGRAITALAKSNSSEAVGHLAEIARGTDPMLSDDPETREFVRQRAVAGLGTMQSREAVVALNQVLQQEHGGDIALSDLAHEGLLELTDHNYPKNPEQWNQVIQAEYQTAPTGNTVDQAIEWK